MARKRTTTQHRRKTKEDIRRDSELWDWIGIVLLVTVTIIAYTKMGAVGIFLNRLCRYLFGNVYTLVLAVIVGQILITMVNRRSGNTSSKSDCDSSDSDRNSFMVFLQPESGRRYKRV